MDATWTPGGQDRPALAVRCRTPRGARAPVLLSVFMAVAGGALLWDVPSAGLLLLAASGLGLAAVHEAVLVEVVGDNDE